MVTLVWRDAYRPRLTVSVGFSFSPPSLSAHAALPLDDSTLNALADIVADTTRTNV